MERQREYSRTHTHPQSKESRKKSNRKYLSHKLDAMQNGPVSGLSR